MWWWWHLFLHFQDPTNLDKFNVSSFFHVKNNLKVLDPGECVPDVGETSCGVLRYQSTLVKLFPPSCSSFIWHCLDEEKAKQDPAYHLKSTNLETRETLAELYRDYKGDQLLASTTKEPEAKKTDKFNAVSKTDLMLKRREKAQWKTRFSSSLSQTFLLILEVFSPNQVFECIELCKFISPHCLDNHPFKVYSVNLVCAFVIQMSLWHANLIHSTYIGLKVEQRLLLTLEIGFWQAQDNVHPLAFSGAFSQATLSDCQIYESAPPLCLLSVVFTLYTGGRQTHNALTAWRQKINNCTQKQNKEHLQCSEEAKWCFRLTSLQM